MKSTYKILSSASLALLLSACAAETPWVGPTDKQAGSFAKSALNFKVQTDHVIKQSRAGNEVVMDTIHLYFFDDKGDLKDFYRYGAMPDVVPLEEGEYTLTAVYTHDGTDEHHDAAWDYPFYQGKSDKFEIQPNKITSDLGVIKCVLENVMTSVEFDPVLRAHMSDDAFVELKLNETGETLDFTVKQQDNNNYGYFHMEGEQSLVATFKGEIDGAYTTEVKTVANVEPGYHYRMTFKLHDYKGESSGQHDTNIVLDATVTTTDIDGNISIEQAGLADADLGDNERPGEEPTEPENPDQPDVPSAPVIKPIGAVKELGVPYIYKAGDEVAISIKSSTGITQFIVTITSDQLDLSEVGLSNTLDLVNPGNQLDALRGLGLLPDENENDNEDGGLRGWKDVKFDITGFMPMLSVFKGEHQFKLTVADDNDTTEETLIVIIQ